MILKSFELSKFDNEKYFFYLLHGENEGHKNEIIEQCFKTKFLESTYRYEEKEILDNEKNFFDTISTKSFFETKKLIIISRATDKIRTIIEDIIEKKIDGITVILNSGLLDKKSKLRSFFEKNKSSISTAFYDDDSRTLSTITSNFFREKKIPISQQLINLLVERCRGSRQNLKNELNKIDSFIIGKKNINLDQIIKLTNLAENYNVSELIDSCLAKNFKKTVNILNENNFSPEDCILIIRTLLNKSKRLHGLLSEINNNKNLEQIISSFKPPIFWKDKEVVKQQMKNWDLNKAENLIYQTSELELTVKKNPSNAINILSDFIISKSNRANS
jgi:DNA polymerase-3 subunit delta